MLPPLPGDGPTTTLASRPGAQLAARVGMADAAANHLRDVLGTVAPRDPVNRRLGPRVHRLDLLAQLLDRETFGYVTQWLAHVRSDNTKRNYADDMRHWARVCSELCGTEPFYYASITGDVITSWRQWTDEVGQSPRTVNRRLSALSSLIEFIKWKTRLPLVSPVTKYDRIKVDIHDETTATPILEVPEFQAVIEECETARQALVVVLIYTLAGRVSECCTAQLTDLKSGGGQCRLDLRRKGGKGEVYTLPPLLCELVDVATAGRLDGNLLLDDSGQPMDRHAVDRLLNRLGRAAHVLPGRDLTPHVLRASKLTHMYDKDTPPEEIRKFAGHSQIVTTMRYIRRRDDGRLKAKHAAAAVAVYDHLVDRWLVEQK